MQTKSLKRVVASRTVASLFRFAGAVALVAGLANMAGIAHAAELPRVAGEAVKPTAATKAAALETMRGSSDLHASAANIALAAMPAAAIDGVRKSNSAKAGQMKSMQIGITRLMKDEAPSAATPKIQWNAAPVVALDQRGGIKLGYLNVKSTEAKAIRLGLRFNNLPEGVEMRFLGSSEAATGVALANARELNTLKDANGLYWSPVTEGESQLVEIVVPAGVDANAVTFSVEAVSHIFSAPSTKFAGLKASNDCNIDVACVAQTPGFVNAKSSVAHMTFQSTCDTGAVATCICTGTLLNDADTSTQVPYFYTANHCISDQATANTLNTHWFFENPTCASQDVLRSSATRVTGGAALLYANTDSDAAFFRLNNSAPVGAFLAGWDPNTININDSITVIHHPGGNPKRVTNGFVERFRNGAGFGLNGSFISPTYTSGTALGGSSGAGIFTINALGDYYLRGGLLGGAASCENAGGSVDSGNWDMYSRFDQVLPNIKQFLQSTGGTATNYTDIWWNANESGWGFQVTHHNNGTTNNIFGTWYTYDEFGNQLFIVLSGCDIQAFDGTTCRGRLYRTTGAPFTQPVFTGTRSVTPIGTGTLQFTSSSTANFTYTIGVTTITKAITRFPFGTGVANFPNDASDIYYQQGADGWGYSLAQHGAGVFGVIYHYDELGNPMFAVLQSNITNNSTVGTLFRTRSNGGSHYLTQTWRSSDISTFAVGDATMTLASPNLSLRFLINNYQQIRTLSRLPF